MKKILLFTFAAMTLSMVSCIDEAQCTLQEMEAQAKAKQAAKQDKAENNTPNEAEVSNQTATPNF